jgi:cell wall-associated NlpC family hydrolase
MKGRRCIAAFFAIFVLPFTLLSGFSKSTARSTKAKTKSIERTLPDDSQNYSVRQGDSLSRIARNFKTTPDAIKSANNLKSDKLKLGQKLRVPVAKTASAKKEAPKPAETMRDPNQTYMSAAPPRPQDETESPNTRLRLVQAGFQWIGVRYRFSGGSEKNGFDCSGLVKSLFSKFNIDLPRSSREQFLQGEKVSKDDLQPGDLVFFSSGGNQPTHVGVYVGNNQMLHAARKAKQVIVTDINKIWDKMRYLGARRMMDLWGDDDPDPEEKN